MLEISDKIKVLKDELCIISDNYADSFKADIFIFINDFELTNPIFSFLNNTKSKIEICNWINKLTARIVLKFDEENEEINSFIFDYIELG